MTIPEGVALFTVTLEEEEVTLKVTSPLVAMTFTWVAGYTVEFTVMVVCLSGAEMMALTFVAL